MGGIPVARLFGVEIRVHWSWVVILALVAALSVAEVGDAAPQLDAAIQWVIGGLVAAGFLASAAAHDLGHALMSRRRGLPVPSISVSFFGGSSPYEVASRDPNDEVIIAAAGPLVSLIVGTLLMAASLGLAAIGGDTLQAVGIFGVVLAILNILLGAVNFVPAYPLDGGRLFRALVWKRTGDERRGSRSAARSGSLIGMALLVVGLVLSLYDVANGLMVLLCGWFLRLTARGAQQRVELEALADGLRAGDVMEPLSSPVAPGLTIDTFADQVLDGDPPRMAVLVERGGEIVGLVGATQLRRLRRSDWPTTRVEQVMVPRERLTELSPDAPVWPAFLRMRELNVDALPVVGPDGLAGLVTLRGIAAAIQQRRGARRPGGPSGWLGGPGGWLVR